MRGTFYQIMWEFRKGRTLTETGWTGKCVHLNCVIINRLSVRVDGNEILAMLVTRNTQGIPKFDLSCDAQSTDH